METEMNTYPNDEKKKEYRQTPPFETDKGREIINCPNPGIQLEENGGRFMDLAMTARKEGRYDDAIEFYGKAKLYYLEADNLLENNLFNNQRFEIKRKPGNLEATVELFKDTGKATKKGVSSALLFSKNLFDYIRGDNYSFIKWAFRGFFAIPRTFRDIENMTEKNVTAFRFGSGSLFVYFMGSCVDALCRLHPNCDLPIPFLDYAWVPLATNLASGFYEVFKHKKKKLLEAYNADLKLLEKNGRI